VEYPFLFLFTVCEFVGASYHILPAVYLRGRKEMLKEQLNGGGVSKGTLYYLQ
jgi:hypothetical protein